VLDTNVIVSGLIQPLGNPAKVLTLALAGAVQVCHEKRIVAEYREVLTRPRFKFNEKQIREVLTKIEKDGQAVDTTDLRDLNLPDLDDEPFLAAALAGKADYLVTGNLADYPAERRRLRGALQFRDYPTGRIWARSSSRAGAGQRGRVVWRHFSRRKQLLRDRVQNEHQRS